MSTFVPNGNKPIKPEVTNDYKQQPIPTLHKTPSGLNPFRGWKSSDKDEFVVDL